VVESMRLNMSGLKRADDDVSEDAPAVDTATSNGKVRAESETTGGMWFRRSFTPDTMRVRHSSSLALRACFWAARAASSQGTRRAKY